MKQNDFSIKALCFIIGIGELFSMIVIIAIFYVLTGDNLLILSSIALIACALTWMLLLIHFFGKRLLVFTSELCSRLESMINGKELLWRVNDEETLFSKIDHRLSRLYEIMQENRQRVDRERKALQLLVSDVSHQVKTPVSNLRMVTDTLITKDVTDHERTEFLNGIRKQIDKLEFLFQALVKTSRLETGVIRLEKKNGRLFDTLAQALSGVMYEAEKKGIEVTVDCSESLKLHHDSKWTAEALFNLLDNAVKYTSAGGKIHVCVEQWEMYVKIAVNDTGKGISEKNQPAIFQRFYREEEVHNEPGVGIGLYLTRKIIIQQGGYIKVSSEVGVGSTFSVFLPKR